MRAGEPVSSTDTHQAEAQDSASLATVTGEAVFMSGADESSRDTQGSTLHADPRVRRAHRKQRSDDRH